MTDSAARAAGTPDAPDVPDDELPEIDEEAIELASVESGLSRELKRLLTLLAGGGAIFALFYFTPLGTLLRDVQQIRAFLKGDDLWAELTFVGIAAALVSIGMPRLVFYGIGGLAFGFWPGLACAQAGSVLGSFLTFFAIRHGGRGWLMARYGEHRFVRKAFRVRSSIKAVALIRQLPLHGMMITGGLALSEVSVAVFILGTFIGYLPQGVVATLIGSGMMDEQALAGIGKLVGAASVLLLGAFLLRRWRASRGAR